MMREVFLQSMQAHGGAIVNMTADLWNGMPGMGHSGAARAGMVNLTQTAAFEWAHAGVRVNAVAPGWIASSGMDTYGGPTKSHHPAAAEPRAAAPPRRRGRGQRRDLLPARPGRGLHHRRHAARSTAARRWAARCSRASTTTTRSPSTASTAPSTPEVLKGGCLMPVLHSRIDRPAASLRRQRAAHGRAAGRGARARGAGDRRVRVASARSFEQRGQLLPRERVARLLDRGSRLPRARRAGRPRHARRRRQEGACWAAAASSASASSPACAC